MNDLLVILYMVTVLIKGLEQSATHDLPQESTAITFTTGVSTATTSYLSYYIGFTIYIFLGSSEYLY